MRLRNRRLKTYRSLSEERKKLQGQLVSRIVSQASSIRIEDLMSKDFKNEAKISASIQRPIDLIVRSIAEKPFLELPQVPLESLLKQEHHNSVSTSKSFHQKMRNQVNTTTSLKPLKRNLFPLACMTYRMVIRVYNATFTQPFLSDILRRVTTDKHNYIRTFLISMSK